jgi:hypothetical protein
MYYSVIVLFPMLIRKAYHYRVYPTRAQAEQLDWIRKPGASLVPTISATIQPILYPD